MRCFTVISFVAFFASTTNAFTSPSLAGATTSRRRSPALGASGSNLIYLNKPLEFKADSGMSVDRTPMYVRQAVEEMREDNFSATLDFLEPLLMHKCPGSTCATYMTEVCKKADQLGMKIPENYGPLHLLYSMGD